MEHPLNDTGLGKEGQSPEGQRVSKPHPGSPLLFNPVLCDQAGAPKLSYSPEEELGGRGGAFMVCHSLFLLSW